MKKPKEYQINSFEDLCNVITPENKDRLLKDMVTAFSGYIAMIEGMRAMEPKVTKGLKNWEVSEYAFIWIDDGKNDVVGMNVSTSDGKFEAKIRF